MMLYGVIVFVTNFLDVCTSFLDMVPRFFVAMYAIIFTAVLMSRFWKTPRATSPDAVPEGDGAWEEEEEQEEEACAVV